MSKSVKLSVLKFIGITFVLFLFFGIVFTAYLYGQNIGARKEERVCDEAISDIYSRITPTVDPQPNKAPFPIVDFEPPPHPNWTTPGSEE